MISNWSNSSLLADETNQVKRKTADSENCPFNDPTVGGGTYHKATVTQTWIWAVTLHTFTAVPKFTQLPTCYKKVE